MEGPWLYRWRPLRVGLDEVADTLNLDHRAVAPTRCDSPMIVVYFSIIFYVGNYFVHDLGVKLSHGKEIGIFLIFPHFLCRCEGR